MTPEPLHHSFGAVKQEGPRIAGCVRAKPASLLLALILICGCGKADPPQSTPAADSFDSTRALTRYPLDDDPEIIKLTHGLNEISGIVFSPDGRLFAHGDERATIYQIDTASGEVIKRFDVGSGVFGDAVTGDFEDIAIVGDTSYLLRSDGVLFEFREGDDETEVEYREFETPLKSKNDVEGLCYDPVTNALLLACKADPGKGYDNDLRAVYSFSLATKQLDEKPRFLVAEKAITDLTGESVFNPSAIVRHPATGTFLLLASAGNALAELAPDGTLLGAMELAKGVHPQPEGIAVSPNGTLFISDEGRGGKGRISRYAERGEK